MTDGEFLDKVCDLTEKWSKPYLVAVGGYLLSTLIIAWNVTDWVVANARDNLGALVAFGIGGILTGAVVASLFWRYVLKKSVDAKEGSVKKRISDEFSSTKGLECVNDLDSLIEAARELALLREQLKAKDAEIAELRQRPTPEEIEAAQSAQSALDEYDRARREARSAFRSLSARDMEFIIGLYESGARTVSDPDPIIAVLGQRGIVRKALDSPLVIDLDPEWRARIDAFRDVFDDVRGKKRECIDR